MLSPPNRALYGPDRTMVFVHSNLMWFGPARSLRLKKKIGLVRSGPVILILYNF